MPFGGVASRIDGCDSNIQPLDVPGTGGSPAPLIPYRFSVLARLVTKLLDQLGYLHVDVLGVSWGGALAQQFAFQYPKRCRRLILVSTGTGALMVPGNPSALAKIATPRRYQDPAYMAQIAGEIYGGKMRTRPELAHEFARTARLGSELGYFYQMLGGVGWTSIFWLRKLRQPTLILHGDDDPLVPLVNAKIMHRLSLVSATSSSFTVLATLLKTLAAYAMISSVARSVLIASSPDLSDYCRWNHSDEDAIPPPSAVATHA